MRSSPPFATLSPLFATLSSLSPRLGCDAFFTFPLPLRVAFASTLTYHDDPSHNLHDPCSPQEASMLMFAPFGSPLCRHRRHFVVTVATLSSPSPLCRHHRHFWVVVTFVTFPLPFRVAFASTLTYDPSHNLQDPCSPQEASILMFALLGRHFVVTCRHRISACSRSPLVKSLLSAHLWSNLSMSPLCRHRRHFIVTVATLSSLSPLCRHRRHFVVTVATFRHLSPLLGCDAFFTFPLPLRVAFASTLTCDPSHNLHDPCSPQETSM